MCVEPLTPGHFDDSTEGLSEAERAQRSVDQGVEFLEHLFADRIVVWGQDLMGGWSSRDRLRAVRSNVVIPIGEEEASGQASLQAFVWSGPYTPVLPRLWKPQTPSAPVNKPVD